MISKTVSDSPGSRNLRLLRLIRSALAANLILPFFGVSCGSQAHRQTTNERFEANQNASSPRPSISANKPLKSIREVDFKNFTYPWYPSYLKAPSDLREITLHEGAFEVRRNKQTGIENLVLELEDVSYAHLTKRSFEDAIITISGVETFNSFVGSVFIYGLENGIPTLRWQHEIGDRADGGLRRIAIKRNTLVVEQYERSEGDGGLCCPKIFVRRYYDFDGQQFKQTKSETLPNKYRSAEFLGYPRDKR